ncbi:hypothetical protein WL32_34195 [Burkholderia cepacia]|uniref:hypothetical protein n=1 Tax=Burkholderia cepacia TaxID=292 RepID=UPI00075B76AC|nr:hypothetical protein [Burkholderia cepacia]KWB14003.1 hypothetical protein WL32_34195 [Burkholderia cepacia]
MTIANAGPSVQDVHAVFDVLGPRSRTGASRASATRPARRARIRHPASRRRSPPRPRSRRRCRPTRATSRRVVGGHAPRRSGPLALAGMRLATNLGLGLGPLT